MRVLQFIVTISVALTCYTGLIYVFPSKLEDIAFLLLGISFHGITMLALERFYISKDAYPIDKLVLICLTTIVYTGVGYYLSSVPYMVGVTVISTVYTIIILKKAVSFNWGG